MSTAAELLFAEVAQAADKEWDDIRNAEPQARGNLPGGLRGVAQLRSISLKKDSNENHRCNVEFIVLKHDPLDEGGDFTNTVDYISLKLVGDQYKTLTERLQAHTVLLIHLGSTPSATEGFADCSAIYDDINARKPLFKFHTFVMEGSDYTNIQCDGPYTGDDIAGVEPTGVDWDHLGTLADQGDESAISDLTFAAENVNLDPNDYGPWIDLAVAIRTATEAATPAPDAPPRKPSNKPDLTALCKDADAGIADAEVHLIGMCEANGIDHNQYAAWSDVMEDLFNAMYPNHAAAEAASQATPPAAKPKSLKAYGAAADAGDEDAVNTLTKMAASDNLDPDEYATWADLAAAMEPAAATPSPINAVVGDLYGYEIDGAVHSVELVSIDNNTMTCELLSHTDAYTYEEMPLSGLVADPNAA